MKEIGLVSKHGGVIVGGVEDELVELLRLIAGIIEMDHLGFRDTVKLPKYN